MLTYISFFSVFDVLFFVEIRSQREMCVIRIQLQLAAEKKYKIKK